MGTIEIFRSWREPRVSPVLLPTIILSSGSLWYPQLLRQWHVPKKKCIICKYERKWYVMQMTYVGPTLPGLSTFELRPLQLSSPLFFLGVTLFLLINCLYFHHCMLLQCFFVPGNKKLDMSAGALWFMQVTIGDLPVRRYNWFMSIISEL